MAFSFKPFSGDENEDESPVLFVKGKKVTGDHMPSDRAWTIAAKNMGLTGRAADEAIAQGKQRVRRGSN